MILARVCLLLSSASLLLARVAEDACKDSIGWVDAWSDGCSWYLENGCSSAVEHENVGGVSALRACCSCGGGNKDFEEGSSCQDMYGFVDEFGDACDWYASHGCDESMYYVNGLGISAKEACCVCGGGSTRQVTSPPVISTAAPTAGISTFLPTLQPTTRQPTLKPTDYPTTEATMKTPEPTSKPTRQPTLVPTMEPTPPITMASPTYAPPETPHECKDSIGWADDWSDSCSYYVENGCASALEHENRLGVSALEACCTCGGGNVDFEAFESDAGACQDMYGFVDEFGDACDWYASHGCDEALAYVNGNGISALEACCVCDGGSTQPSTVPTTAPTGPEFCFSGLTQVVVQTQGPMEMRHLKLGDMVAVGPDTFEPIYSFGHYQPNGTSNDFLRIVTNSSRAQDQLQLSRRHMVFVEQRGAVPACLLQVGDVLQYSGNVDALEITAITQLTVDSGFYAPFTPSGKLLLANGVVVSSYVSFQDDSVFKIGGHGISFHWLAHSFEFPHRVACYYLRHCSQETYDEIGISHWVAIPLRVAVWLMDLQSTWLQSVLVVFALIVACTFSVAEIFLLSSKSLWGFVVGWFWY